MHGVLHQCKVSCSLQCFIHVYIIASEGRPGVGTTGTSVFIFIIQYMYCIAVLTQRYRYELRKKYPPPSLFCEPHLSDLMNEVAAKILHKWRCVGIQLGLGYNELTALSVSCRDDLDLCFSSVFTIWQDSKTKPYTWLTIIDCLRTPSVNEVRLAENLTASLEDVESDETPL